MQDEQTQQQRFAARYIDLLNEKVGGKALACSDEWFAECANLVKDSAPKYSQDVELHRKWIR